MPAHITAQVANIFFWIQAGFFSVLLLYWWCRSKKNSLQKKWRRLLIVIFAQTLFYLSYEIYSWWYYAQSPTWKYLLPPHSSFFYRQAFVGAEILVSGILISLLIWWLLSYIFNKRKLEQIDETDISLIIIGSLVSGWPATFVFLGITFMMSVLGLIIMVISRRRQITDRLILTPYIIPSAIITILLKPQLLDLTHLVKIGF